MVNHKADVIAFIFFSFQMADVIAIILCVAGGRPLDYTLQHWKMADVIAKWKMEEPLL